MLFLVDCVRHFCLPWSVILSLCYYSMTSLLCRPGLRSNRHAATDSGWCLAHLATPGYNRAREGSRRMGPDGMMPCLPVAGERNVHRLRDRRLIPWLQGP